MMKYGESIFDICYLLFAIVSGCIILKRAANRAEKEMGLAALILGCGDAFHLIPRVLNYFVEGDFTAALGIGKLITSITMTVFYILLYDIWHEFYNDQKEKKHTVALWSLGALRIALCLFPQNAWLENGNNVAWAIIRNVPFVMIGAIICWMYYQKREMEKEFRYVWIYILLSFAFYIPVAVAAGIIPILGMLMLPKTVCYILMIVAFLRVVMRKECHVDIDRS